MSVKARCALLATGLTVSALALSTSPAAASPSLTKTVTDKKTHFSARVPSGYTLTVKKSAYTISGKAGSVTLERLKTKDSPATIGTQIIKVAGGTVTRSSGSKLVGTYTAKGKVHRLEVTKKSGGVLLASYSGKAAKAHVSPAALAAAADPLALLRQIAGTATGGRTLTPGTGIPMRPFTTPDGGATATVPNTPGWTYSGGGGIVEGINPAVGVFAFGVNYPVSVPGGFTFGQPGSINGQRFTTPAAGMSDSLPTFFRSAGLQLDSITATATFPGAEQVLGAPFSSGFFTVTASAGGHPLTGVVLFGGAPDPRFDDGQWIAYTSFVLVDPNTDPRVGAALLTAWGSWNPSVNQAERQAATLRTILSTNVGGGPIDPDVFAAASADWDDYLRS